MHRIIPFKLIEWKRKTPKLALINSGEGNAWLWKECHIEGNIGSRDILCLDKKTLNITLVNFYFALYYLSRHYASTLQTHETSMRWLFLFLKENRNFKTIA